MDIFTDISFKEIVLGTLTTIIVSILTYILTVVYKLRLPSISKIVFWKKFLKDLVIIPSEITYEHDPVHRPGKQFSLIPSAEAFALIDLVSFFRLNFKFESKIASVQSASDFDNLKENNLLIVGGPKFNSASHILLEEIDNKLSYQFKRIRQKTEVSANDPDFKAFLDTENKEAFIYDSKQNLHFGTIIITKNPYNPKKKVVILGGLLQISTLGATQWFIKLSTRNIIENLLFGKGFQAIISCKENDHTKIRNLKKEQLIKFKK